MTMRCEVIGNATLLLADARDVLPGIAADVVCTDPVWPNCPPDLLAGGEDPQGLWDDTMRLLPEVRRIVTVLRRDSDPRFFASMPRRYRFLCAISLPYVIPAYIGRVLGCDEPVACVPGRRLVPGRGPAAQPARRPPNGHPCSRAQVHFDWLVSWCSDPGEVVLDPFMGSGTTGVACAKLGRPFIGVEIHEPYFDLACRRIEAVQRQGDLLHRFEEEFLRDPVVRRSVRGASPQTDGALTAATANAPDAQKVGPPR